MIALILLAVLQDSPPKTFSSTRALREWLDRRYQGDDNKAAVRVVLENARRERRERTLLRYRRQKEELWSTLLCYLSPPDDRGTATLTIEQKQDDDQQRIYLPALKAHRRIPASRKGDSWAGTDFSFEDLQERELDDFEDGPLKSATVDGHECWAYTIRPKSKDKSSYSRIDSWVRKDIGEPVREIYYDANGKQLKVLNLMHLKKIQGIWTPLYWEMHNVQEDHMTYLVVTKIRYNSKIADDMFTARAMTEIPGDFEGEAIPEIKIP